MEKEAKSTINTLWCMFLNNLQYVQGYVHEDEKYPSPILDFPKFIESRPAVLLQSFESFANELRMLGILDDDNILQWNTSLPDTTIPVKDIEKKEDDKDDDDDEDEEDKDEDNDEEEDENEDEDDDEDEDEEDEEDENEEDDDEDDNDEEEEEEEEEEDDAILQKELYHILIQLLPMASTLNEPHKQTMLQTLREFFDRCLTNKWI